MRYTIFILCITTCFLGHALSKVFVENRGRNSDCLSRHLNTSRTVPTSRLGESQQPQNTQGRTYVFAQSWPVFKTGNECADWWKNYKFTAGNIWVRQIQWSRGTYFRVTAFHRPSHLTSLSDFIYVLFQKFTLFSWTILTTRPFKTLGYMPWPVRDRV